jgi:hypothetical protein
MTFRYSTAPSDAGTCGLHQRQPSARLARLLSGCSSSCYPTARLLVSHPTVRLPFLGPCELHVLALAFGRGIAKRNDPSSGYDRFDASALRFLRVGKVLVTLPACAPTIQPVQEQPGVVSGPLTAQVKQKTSSRESRTASVTMYIIGIGRFRL